MKYSVSVVLILWLTCTTRSVAPQYVATPLTKEVPTTCAISIGETVSLNPLKVAGKPTLFLFNPNSPDGVFRVAEEVFEVLPGEVPDLTIGYDTPGRRHPSMMICRCSPGVRPPLDFDCPGCSEDTDLECPEGQSYECVSKAMSTIIQVEGPLAVTFKANCPLGWCGGFEVGESISFTLNSTKTPTQLFYKWEGVGPEVMTTQPVSSHVYATPGTRQPEVRVCVGEECVVARSSTLTVLSGSGAPPPPPPSSPSPSFESCIENFSPTTDDPSRLISVALPSPVTTTTEIRLRLGGLQPDSWVSVVEIHHSTWDRQPQLLAKLQVRERGDSAILFELVANTVSQWRPRREFTAIAGGMIDFTLTVRPKTTDLPASIKVGIAKQEQKTTMTVVDVVGLHADRLAGGRLHLVVSGGDAPVGWMFESACMTY